ncbi:DUF3658 domain-containing protein [Aromatoleum petrolei]|nr:DUF3658 domain-containing protein [Aromatoleum petrolei]
MGFEEAVVPGADARGRRAVSQFEPGEFGELLGRTRVLDAAEITRLAQEWQRNAAIASGVRRWADGRVSHHGDDYYDGLLLAQYDDEWQPAGQAIGLAMWDCRIAHRRRGQADDAGRRARDTALNAGEPNRLRLTFGSTARPARIEINASPDPASAPPAHH